MTPPSSSSGRSQPARSIPDAPLGLESEMLLLPPMFPFHLIGREHRGTPLLLPPPPARPNKRQTGFSRVRSPPTPPPRIPAVR